MSLISKELLYKISGVLFVFGFYFFVHQSAYACPSAGTPSPNNQGWCYTGVSAPGGGCYVDYCLATAEDVINAINDRAGLAGNPDNTDFGVYDAEKGEYFGEEYLVVDQRDGSRFTLSENNLKDENINVNIDYVGGAKADTRLGAALDKVFGQLKHFYSNLIRGRFGAAFSSQYKIVENPEEAPSDDGVVGRRRFYYDRIYTDDGCTARRWHWSENAGYFVSASFPCGQEPWSVSPEGAVVDPLDGTVDDSTVAQSNQCQTRVDCPPLVVMNHDCSWEPSLETVCADVPGNGTGVFSGLNPAVLDDDSKITDKDLYCEVDARLSLDAQKAAVESCVKEAEISEKEKSAVLEAINARN